jgi:hypothetical protein
LGEGRFLMGMEVGNDTGQAGGHDGSELTIWFLRTDYYLDLHYLALPSWAILWHFDYTKVYIVYVDMQTCKGNLTDLRRILHLSLAKGNPK